MTMVRGLLACLLAGGSLFVSVPSAFAEESLVATLPQAGQELNQLPVEVRLAFSMALADGEMTVTNSSGAAVLADSTVVEINNISSRLKFDLPRDTYTVKYRVKSVDTGRTYGGSFQFALGSGDFADLPEKPFGGSSNVPSELAAGSSDAAPMPTPTPTSDATPTPTTSPSDSDADSAGAALEDSPGSSWWPWAAIPAGLLAVLTLVIAFRRRSRSGNGAEDTLAP